MKWNPAIFEVVRDRHGYSLIELIMVIVFVSIAFVATLSMMTGGMQRSAETEILTQAVQLAEKKMEAIRSDKNSLGYHYLMQENYPVELNPEGLSGFKRSVVIVDFGSYKQITVKVEHESIKPVTLVTHMANY